MPDVAGEWLSFLLSIREDRRLSCLRFFVVSSVPPGKYRDGTSNYASNTSLYILPNSLTVQSFDAVVSTTDDVRK